MNTKYFYNKDFSIAPIRFNTDKLFASFINKLSCKLF